MRHWVVSSLTPFSLTSRDISRIANRVFLLSFYSQFLGGPAAEHRAYAMATIVHGILAGTYCDVLWTAAVHTIFIPTN